MAYGDQNANIFFETLFLSFVEGFNNHQRNYLF